VRATQVSRRSLKWILAIVALAIVRIGGATDRAAAPIFRVALPFGWEYQVSPPKKNSPWYIDARQRSGDRIDQILRLTIIDMQGSASNVTSESLRQLVGDLAASSGTEVEALPRNGGYYFSAANSEPAHRQRLKIEGVLLRPGCLVRFMLYTDDANRVDRDNILEALSRSSLQ
jgi:hypothetical protein